MINMLQRDEYLKIEELKRAISDLEFVEKAVKHRHRELEATMSAIRLQKSLMDVEVRAGAQYGDESDPTAGGVVVPEDDELDDLFSNGLDIDSLDDTEGSGEEEGEEEGEEDSGSESEPEPEPEPVEVEDTEEPDPAEEPDPVEEPVENSDDGGFDLDELIGGTVGAEDEGRVDFSGDEGDPEEADLAVEPSSESEAVEATPQDAVEAMDDDPKDSDKDDPDVDAFLEGEDFSDLFADL
jgi:hypothetical protein